MGEWDRDRGAPVLASSLTCLLGATFLSVCPGGTNFDLISVAIGYHFILLHFPRAVGEISGAMLALHSV